MPKALKEIVRQCDTRLRTAEIQDYDGAWNGLQVANLGTVTRLAAAVDANLATVKLAIAARADLLIVHHGLSSTTRPSAARTGKTSSTTSTGARNGRSGSRASERLL